jgi:hypothetical protein
MGRSGFGFWDVPGLFLKNRWEAWVDPDPDFGDVPCLFLKNLWEAWVDPDDRTAARQAESSPRHSPPTQPLQKMLQKYICKNCKKNSISHKIYRTPRSASAKKY